MTKRIKNKAPTESNVIPEAMPEVKKLNQTYGKDVVFVNLSFDKTSEKWIQGIEKYEVEGKELCSCACQPNHPIKDYCH